VIDHLTSSDRLEIEAFLAKTPDVPAFATGKWRDDPPRGSKSLHQYDEAQYSAFSVSKYIPGPFTLIEMGKGSTQVVTFR
jgi:hypothetical protein